MNGWRKRHWTPSVQTEHCWNGGKVMYSLKRDAQAAANAVRRKGGAVCGVYECPYCGAWHLTHARNIRRK